MKIIEEYKNVTEEIAVTKSQLQTAKRNLDKLINTYKPKNVGGIDYSKDRVESSMSQKEIMEVANEICKVNVYISTLEGLLRSLYSQRAELEKTINELGDINKQILMLQIKGLKQWQIAKELNYSQRQMRRLIRKLKDVL